MACKRHRLLFLCALILPLAACEMRPQPTSDLPGYYAVDQRVPGGRLEGDINLNQIEVYNRTADSVLQLGFCRDSIHSGAMAPIGPPPYVVSMLQNPTRLVVTLTGVRYWEYADSLGFQRDMLIAGVFRNTSADGETQIIANLTRLCGYKVEAHKGTLRILLSPLPDDPSTGFAVLADAFELSHEMPILPDYTPTLCGDGATVRMISPLYTTQDAARAEADRVDAELAQVLSSPAMVVPMHGLPPDGETEMARKARARPLLRQDGAEIPGELMASGGRFLCWMPRSEQALMAFPTQGTKRQPAPESLWIVEPDTHRTRLMHGDFTSVAEAKVSPDGSLIGFIEQDGENRYMGLYDPRMRELSMLSEEGFGRQTASFDFLSEGMIVGITGDEMLQLCTYDRLLSADEQKPRVVGLEERPAGYGSVQASAGKILYLGDDGTVLSYDPATAARERLTTGHGFTLSPTGDYMAVTDYEPNQEDVQTSLRVRDMRTGRETAVSSSAMLMRLFWSRSGDALYYIHKTQDEAYPYSLHAFKPETGDTLELGDLVSCEAWSGGPGEIILVLNADEKGYYPMTFRIQVH